MILYGMLYPPTFLLRTGRTESKEGFVLVCRKVWGLKGLKQNSVIIFEGTSTLVTECVPLHQVERDILGDVQLSESRTPVLSLWSWQSTAAVTQIQRDLGETEHERTF